MFATKTSAWTCNRTSGRYTMTRSLSTSPKPPISSPPCVKPRSFWFAKYTDPRHSPDLPNLTQARSMSQKTGMSLPSLIFQYRPQIRLLLVISAGSATGARRWRTIDPCGTRSNAGRPPLDDIALMPWLPWMRWMSSPYSILSMIPPRVTKKLAAPATAPAAGASTEKMQNRSDAPLAAMERGVRRLAQAKPSDTAGFRLQPEIGPMAIAAAVTVRPIASP
mmetsp:Transcript_41307/g.113904  ORF Transcript_41307/g.113904 Transcript_41307/m.113904 type:complete len:221 (-) Transcript_41307:257-919(-)